MAMEAFRETLAGLTGVNIQVEPVNADAEQDGLLRTDLQADVESALREAGIRVFTQPELFAVAPGTPFLHVDVMTIRLNAQYAYTVRVELWQAVTLVRDPGIRTLGCTWNSPQLVGTVTAGRLPEIRRAVRSAVDEFIQDSTVATATRAAVSRRPA
jgi:hypothetical protein